MEQILEEQPTIDQLLAAELARCLRGVHETQWEGIILTADSDRLQAAASLMVDDSAYPLLQQLAALHHSQPGDAMALRRAINDWNFATIIRCRICMKSLDFAQEEVARCNSVQVLHFAMQQMLHEGHIRGLRDESSYRALTERVTTLLSNPPAETQQ